jgi:S-disulfanyl-L-cysteine oxidoreductase SoxD
MRQSIIAAALLYVCASISIAGAGQAPGGSSPSVWTGVYTDAQAARGRTQYNQHCASCHGGDLSGGEAKALAGETFWTSWREDTVGELLGQISKSMPFSEDGSLAGTLSTGTYVDIVTHILKVNGLPAGSIELTPQAAAGVRIIAKDGPGELPATTLARVVGCLTPRVGREWRLVKATAPERASASNPTAATTAALGSREFALKFVLTPLDKYVGYRVQVTGALMGEGGVDGINVNPVTPVAEKCE